MEDLVTIIDNAGGYADELVLYAVVPLLDVVAIDLDRPILLERYSVAAWDGMNGSFFDLVQDEALIIAPGSMEMVAITGPSPADDICDMTTHGHRTRLRNLGAGAAA